MKNTRMIALISALIFSFGMTACSGASESSDSAGRVSTAPSLSMVTEEGTAADTDGGSDTKTPAASHSETITYETNAVPPSPAVTDAKKDADYGGEAYAEEIAADAPAYSAKSDSYRAEAYSGEAAEAVRPVRPSEVYEEYSLDEPAIDDILTPPTPIQDPEAGLLTAGEWNDNDNWGFFINLVNAQKISFPSYGIDPCFRTKVTVKDNTDKQPVVNAKVSIYGKDNALIWTAVTDKNGVAYLFTDEADAEFTGIVECGEAKTEFTGKAGTDVQTVPDDQQRNDNVTASESELTLDSKGAGYKKTDIMFIVDATGSMSDEMIFLQKEFTDISEKIGDENTRYSVNFYRDEGDEYVTKCSDFTDDAAVMQELLNGQYATGGGDTPEAVDRILDECMNNKSWSEDSVKLAFLIFDAPPHAGTEDSLKASIKTAAEKGIRLIPVVASNAERDTELFGRAVAIKTGGTYVFLTDDSGVGDSHLEPIIGKYSVEKLNDLIIRIINSYKQ